MFTWKHWLFFSSFFIIMTKVNQAKTNILFTLILRWNWKLVNFVPFHQNIKILKMSFSGSCISYLYLSQKMAMHMFVGVVKALYFTQATIMSFRPFNCLYNMPCSLFSWFSSEESARLLRFYTHIDTDCSNNVAQ